LEECSDSQKARGKLKIRGRTPKCLKDWGRESRIQKKKRLPHGNSRESRKFSDGRAGRCVKLSSWGGSDAAKKRELLSEARPQNLRKVGQEKINNQGRGSSRKTQREKEGWQRTAKTLKKKIIGDGKRGRRRLGGSKRAFESLQERAWNERGSFGDKALV